MVSKKPKKTFSEKYVFFKQSWKKQIVATYKSVRANSGAWLFVGYSRKNRAPLSLSYFLLWCPSFLGYAQFSK